MKLKVSATPSNTATNTPTYSPSVSLCPTLTPTPSTTVTMTMTPTITKTSTSTPSITQTSTPSQTSTSLDCNLEGNVICITPTPSTTPVITPSITQTSTNTPSVTNTSTSTTTPNLTASNTPSVTATITPTASIESTPTNTPTITNTQTASQTQTNTPTNTISPTSSQTNTPSETPTNTPTMSMTNTQTQTPSITSTQTNTPTLTSSQTSTPSVTPTYTPSATYVPILETQDVIFSDDTNGKLFAYNPNPSAPNYNILRFLTNLGNAQDIAIINDKFYNNVYLNPDTFQITQYSMVKNPFSITVDYSFTGTSDPNVFGICGYDYNTLLYSSDGVYSGTTSSGVLTQVFSYSGLNPITLGSLVYDSSNDTITSSWYNDDDGAQITKFDMSGNVLDSLLQSSNVNINNIVGLYIFSGETWGLDAVGTLFYMNWNNATIDGPVTPSNLITGSTSFAGASDQFTAIVPSPTPSLTPTITPTKP